MVEHGILETPFGAIRLSWSEAGLHAIELLPRPTSNTLGGAPPVELVRELNGYFRDPTWHFDLRLALAGSPFQQRVWEALRTIPAGQTVTYGALARRLGTSPRAVGGACRTNPCPLVVPCHRVIGSHGLGGFAGQVSGPLAELKVWLLEHEGVRLT